jgi:polyhydroxyalkanoate synthesis repressor PhaR
MNRKPVIIKKYGNRRLYDTTHSRYINQDEVAQMVRDGHAIQVVDAATGEDLTRLVLTQIIVEHAKEPDSPFPLDILRQMVVASGKATQEATLKYTKAVLDMYQNAYRAMAPPLSPFEFIQTPAPPRSNVPEAPWGSEPAEGSHRAGTPEQKKHEPAEVDELKQRVEELESLVSKLGTGKPVRKRKGKSGKKR